MNLDSVFTLMFGDLRLSDRRGKLGARYQQHRDYQIAG